MCSMLFFSKNKNKKKKKQKQKQKQKQKGWRDQISIQIYHFIFFDFFWPVIYRINAL